MNSYHFQVNSCNKNFNEKQKNLFNELDKVIVTLPQNAIQYPDERNIEDDDVNNCEKQSIGSLRGRKSMFKRPELPLRKCLPVRKVADFQKNPHKWTKYTLEDVKNEDMSERGNRQAALSFLKELENRKSKSETQDEETLPTKITFQKSSLVRNEKNRSNTQVFKNSKVIMPEYVVGQRIKKEKKIREKQFKQTPKELVLKHLMEDDM